MARMLLKGTAKRKAAEIAAALDSMGAEMNASAGRNTIYLSARCLAEDFEKTFDLAADCLLRPAFPQDELERVRALVLQELAHMTDTPMGEASLFFNRVFFTDSPYQFPVSGTPEVVKAMTRERLDAWHKKYVAGNNLVVAVFGGIDLVKAAHYAAGQVEALPPNKDLSFPHDVAPRAVAAREVYVKPSDKGAAIVYVAYPGIDIYNKRDRFAMDILSTIVSGIQMPGGWLFEELRGKGLVYEVHAFSMEGLRPGYFAAMAVCQPEKAAEVVRLIEAAMDRATREDFPEEQLAPARATVITGKELARETVDGLAFEAAVDEALGLGHEFAREEIDRIRKVRSEDVIRVAREYLKKPVICIVTSDPAAAEAVRK
jgi:zinc protease